MNYVAYNQDRDEWQDYVTRRDHPQHTYGDTPLSCQLLAYSVQRTHSLLFSLAPIDDTAEHH